MAGLVSGNFNDWSPDKARQQALAQAAERAGHIQGYMNKDVETRPEFDYGQQARDTSVQANTLLQESSSNAANNSIIKSINQTLAEQQAAQQAALEASLATVDGQSDPLGASTPRLSSYMRALRKSNDMKLGERDYDGSIGTYAIDQDLLSGKQGPEGGWDKQALGRDVTTEQFLNSKKLQNQVSRYKFGKYLKRYGEAGALSKWFDKTSTDTSPEAMKLFLSKVLNQLEG